MSENQYTENKKSASIDLLEARRRALRSERAYTLEYSGNINGIEIINDSAATTLESAGESLLAFEDPVVWIVDTKAHSQNFRMLSEVVQAKVKAIVAQGEFADEVYNTLRNELGYFVSAHSWEEALEMATLVATEGDNILFSPGCRASDPFDGFADRGAYFNRLVKIKSESN